jgi:hypothetical protein
VASAAHHSGADFVQDAWWASHVQANQSGEEW